MRKLLLMVLVLFFVASGVCFANTVKAYYPDGKIKAVLNYNKNKQLNGPYKNYWHNGKVKEQGVYKEGKRVGKVTRFTIEGERLGQ